jgi:hypothetical protein
MNRHAMREYERVTREWMWDCVAVSSTAFACAIVAVVALMWSN